MDFSEKLLALQKAEGLTQEQLAEKLDVSRQAVTKWELIVDLAKKEGIPQVNLWLWGHPLVSDFQKLVHGVN